MKARQIEPNRFSQDWVDKILKRAKSISEMPAAEIDEWFAGTGYAEYTDSRPKGFRLRLRVSKKGNVSYFLLERIKEYKSGNGVTTFKIGNASTMSLAGATGKARIWQDAISRGENPRLERSRKHKEKLESEGPTFEILYREKIKYGNLSKSTENDYRKGFEILLNYFAYRTIDTITSDEIVRAHRDITEKNGATTADKTMGVARLLINRAINDPDPKHKPINSNIVIKTFKHKAKFNNPGGQARRVSQSIDQDAWKPMWKAINDLRDRTPKRHNKDLPNLALTASRYFTLTLFTGMRGGQASTIEWDQVNLQRGTVNWTDEDDIEKTKGKRRITNLPISDPVWEMLREMHAEETDRHGKAEGYVFKSAGNSQFGHVEKNMPYWFKVIKGEVGESIKGRRPHDVRSTFITIGRILGFDKLLVERLVGHKIDENKEVHEGYITYDIDFQRSVANKIVNYFLSYVGEKTFLNTDFGLPEDVVLSAQKSVNDKQKAEIDVITRWVRLGEMIDKLPDDTEIRLLKNLIS